jgi:hypothetical protein
MDYMITSVVIMSRYVQAMANGKYFSVMAVERVSMNAGKDTARQ